MKYKTNIGRDAARCAAYELLNQFERHPLKAQLGAAAIILSGGMPGAGDSAKLDRMAQALGFLCRFAEVSMDADTERLA
jgi:hypothetical protein